MPRQRKGTRIRGTLGALVHMDRPDGTIMDVGRHFHGRPAARTWTPHGTRLDVCRQADGRVHAQRERHSQTAPFQMPRGNPNSTEEAFHTGIPQGSTLIRLDRGVE